MKQEPGDPWDEHPSTTTVYYTSNREDPAFEAKVRKRLASSNPWPLISVSQQALPGFGRNIVVGDVGCCDANALRQLQIGAETATTPFIALAEADALYPPDYFHFVPPTVEACYRYANVWILSLWKPRDGAPSVFKRKYYSECAQVVGREFLLRHLEATLSGRPLWSSPDDVRLGLVFRRKPPEWTLFGDGSPAVVNVKTGRGLRLKTGTVRNGPTPTELPLWGNADRLRRWMRDPDA